MRSGGVDVEEREERKGGSETARGRDVVLVRSTWIDRAVGVVVLMRPCGAWLDLGGKAAPRRAEARGCVIPCPVVTGGARCGWVDHGSKRLRHDAAAVEGRDRAAGASPRRQPGAPGGARASTNACAMSPRPVL